ncbi:MAG: hypothetical protein JWN50_278 [Parcubacteria group bacterium]|nr:hypothetical protein [Parcubacteria group bacterium]
MNRRELYERGKENPVSLWQQLAAEAEDPVLKELYKEYAKIDAAKMATTIGDTSIPDNNEDISRAAAEYKLVSDGPSKFEAFAWWLGKKLEGLKLIGRAGLEMLSKLSDGVALISPFLIFGLSIITGFQVYGMAAVSYVVVAALLSLVAISIAKEEFDIDHHVAISSSLLVLWLVVANVTTFNTTIVTNPWALSPGEAAYAFVLKDGDIVDVASFHDGENNWWPKLIHARAPENNFEWVRPEAVSHQSFVTTIEEGKVRKRRTYLTDIRYVIEVRPLTPGRRIALPTMTSQMESYISYVNQTLEGVATEGKSNPPSKGKYHEAANSVISRIFRVRVLDVTQNQTSFEVETKEGWYKVNSRK